LILGLFSLQVHAKFLISYNDSNMVIALLAILKMHFLNHKALTI